MIFRLWRQKHVFYANCANGYHQKKHEIKHFEGIFSKYFMKNILNCDIWPAESWPKRQKLHPVGLGQPDVIFVHIFSKNRQFFYFCQAKIANFPWFPFVSRKKCSFPHSLAQKSRGSWPSMDSIKNTSWLAIDGCFQNNTRHQPSQWLNMKEEPYVNG